MNHSPRTRTVTGCCLLVLALVGTATACGSDDSLSSAPYDAAAQLSFGGIKKGADADPDKPLEISSKSGEGRITDVTAVDATGRYLPGRLSDDGSRWHSTAPLASGAHYTLRVSTENSDGAPGRKVVSFATANPRHKNVLKVEFGPKKGEYGVGQPITAKLSSPVKDKAARAVVERALSVQSRPAAEGSWYWVSSRELHYRPRAYWPAHATIEVRSGLKGIKIGGGMWGGDSNPLRITTGDKIEAVTDASSHRMTVYRNGEEINDLPVTTGKPGFETRNGVKVVLGKEAFVRMRSSTVGIAAGSGDSYDLPVHWATRVTWSGEYVHAAPWSVGSQGSANTSHGCTGMSTDDAEWFFNTVHVGDIVKVVGSDGDEMTPFDNGFGDWNLSWPKWRQGSAVTGSGTNDTGSDAVPSVQAARLRPQV
ncbi:Ig-like domain-containing protein [Streptomyces sp. NPDC050560]|uniref:L,D-transpeptidase n=1 Tax=Streptomyces sp. NPDC050560 TaxID=3365630 RepID=UPI0037AD395D